MGKPPAQILRENETSTRAEATIEELIERELEGKIARRDLPVVAHRITQIVVSEQFSGPMPHPKHFREYDAILPGAAERLLSMAERNLDHNIAGNREALAAEIADRKRGMQYGAGLFAALILCAFVSLFVTTNPIVPGLFVGTAAIGGIAAFIRGRNGPQS
jgi:uncharacterized membrane protein